MGTGMPFVSPFRRLCCPFCCRLFHLAEAPCRIFSSSGETQPDGKVGDFFDIPAPELGPVEEPPTGLFRRLVRRFLISRNREAGAVIRRWICPHCHMALPKAMADGAGRSQIIAVVGSRGVGKTLFLGVLIHALKTRYSDEVGFSIWDQETFSVSQLQRVRSDTLLEMRYGPMFGETNRRAVSLNLGASRADARVPLIYRLQFPKRPIDCLFHPLSNPRGADLVFFDGIGEGSDSLTGAEQFWRYVLRAAGVIFLFDPFGCEGIRNRFPRNAPDSPYEVSDPAQVVSSVLNMFATSGMLRPGRKLDVPVAFVLTKSDILRDILPDGSRLLRDPTHDRGVNLRECECANAEVIEILRMTDCHRLLALADNSFKSYCFFGLSSLGETPPEQLRLADLRPIRVADPLLWILWKLGHAPPMRGAPRT